MYSKSKTRFHRQLDLVTNGTYLAFERHFEYVLAYYPARQPSGDSRILFSVLSIYLSLSLIVSVHTIVEILLIKN